jgi:hypothetical protein
VRARPGHLHCPGVPADPVKKWRRHLRLDPDLGRPRSHSRSRSHGPRDVGSELLSCVRHLQLAGSRRRPGRHPGSGVDPRSRRRPPPLSPLRRATRPLARGREPRERTAPVDQPSPRRARNRTRRSRRIHSVGVAMTSPSGPAQATPRTAPPRARAQRPRKVAHRARAGGVVDARSTPRPPSAPASRNARIATEGRRTSLKFLPKHFDTCPIGTPSPSLQPGAPNGCAANAEHRPVPLISQQRSD